jgi:hypothetical protein
MADDVLRIARYERIALLTRGNPQTAQFHRLPPVGSMAACAGLLQWV